MGKLGDALRALLYLLCGVIGMVVVAIVMDDPRIVAFYGKRFDFRPGAVVAERIANSHESARTCIILGASTARQGLDAALLSERLAPIKFLNAGTTGGTIEVLELQARIIARYDVHYRCIIAALHPWLLKEVQRPEIVDTEYMAHLGAFGPLELSGDWWKEKELGKVALAMALPLRKHSGQLGRMIRYALFAAQDGVKASPLPIEDFEILDHDLRPYPTFGYPGNPKGYATNVAALEEALRSLSWLDPAMYVNAPTVSSFEAALHLLAGQTEQLFVVTLPDTPLWNGPNAWASPTYHAVLDGLRGRVTEIDCQGTLNLDEFVDHAHANDDGRRELTLALAASLASDLSVDSGGRDGAVRSCNRKGHGVGTAVDAAEQRFGR